MPESNAAPVGVVGKASKPRKKTDKQPSNAAKPATAEKKNEASPIDKAADIDSQVVPPESGHCPRMVETRLSRRQGAALKMLHTNWQRKETCEMEGRADEKKSVEEFPHCIRRLLDLVADDYEATTGDILKDRFNEEGRLI